MSQVPLAAASPALSEDLRFTANLSADYLNEFCRAATALLRQEAPMTKMYANAAKQLSVQTTEVESCVQALAYVMLRAAKVSAPPDRLFEGVSKFDTSAEQTAVLTITEFYAGVQPDLTEVCVGAAPRGGGQLLSSPWSPPMHSWRHGSRPCRSCNSSTGACRHPRGVGVHHVLGRVGHCDRRGLVTLTEEARSSLLKSGSRGRLFSRTIRSPLTTPARPQPDPTPTPLPTPLPTPAQPPARLPTCG